MKKLSFFILLVVLSLCLCACEITEETDPLDSIKVTAVAGVEVKDNSVTLTQSQYNALKSSPAEIADGENLFSYSDNKHISFYQISLVVIRIGCGNLTEWHVDRCRSRKGTAFFIKSHSIVDD